MQRTRRQKAAGGRTPRKAKPGVDATRGPRTGGTRRTPGSRRPASDPYARIGAIDGRHPLATVAPSAVVPYPARRRRDGEVAFFNFALARELGLIPARHPDTLTPALRRRLLETFGLTIVNEWDEAHGNLPTARDRRPYPYMATRYLQLQHPDKRGLGSGDGRSIWNGLARGRNGTYDVSSCGTGVTRLCPATSAEGVFFRTGNGDADYGCGTAHIEEGLGAALMSEAFARNGVRTERVLAVLSMPNDLAINVRIAPSLLRPSHFFGLLRRGETEDLRRLVDYYAEREIAEGRWPRLASPGARVRYLVERVARDFARATATFESEYIFCWLDWDGDNVLTDGSILDYGSVRQFGLYHHSYRFEDCDRMSTSIPEQRRKARQIVQRFAQIRELLLRGTAPPLQSLRDDPALAAFDAEFETHRRRVFLTRLGLERLDVDALLRSRPDCLESLLRLHRRLERRKSSRGPHRVPDGLSWNAVYCLRDVLRELPAELLATATEEERANPPPLPAERFYSIALSDYASRRDRRLTPYRRRLAREYQRAYLALLDVVARQRRPRRRLRDVLASIAAAAAAHNPVARMTGDGLTHATHILAEHRGRLAPEETFRLIQAFADFQQHEGSPRGPGIESERPLVRRIHAALVELAHRYRESL